MSKCIWTKYNNFTSSHQAYFYAEAPDKQKLFGRITGKNYPLQFGRYLFKALSLSSDMFIESYFCREVMAHEKLLNMSSRVDWKVDFFTCENYGPSIYSVPGLCHRQGIRDGHGEGVQEKLFFL